MPDRGDTATFYGFPEVQPQFYTRLTFAKYFRPSPGSQYTTSGEMHVRLPLPSSLQDAYNMQINSVNFDLLGNLDKNVGGDILAAGQSAAEKFTSAYNNGQMMSTIKDIVLGTAALTPGVSDSNLSRFIQSNVGMVRNPHLTTIFEGVGLKSFTFAWKLSPKSQAEAQKMNTMIQSMKNMMHPGLVGGKGFALEYPYIVRVEFFTGDSSKYLMPNVNWSFLTSLEIDTSTAGIPAFYKDGQPATITMLLHFTEINIRTREDFPVQ
jgi:hypothetical protein